GVSKKVIADMFGMALRTYHRKVRSSRQSATEEGRTVWEAVLDYIGSHEPVAALEVHRRFVRDDLEVVTGVLNDLVNSGLVYRAGRDDSDVCSTAASSAVAIPNERNW